MKLTLIRECPMNNYMKRSILFLLVLLMSVSAANNMYVHAPHGTTRLYKANVEEVAVSIKPKGLFSEIGLYLTIGEKGNSYSYNDARDSLEIVMDFELPEEAVVTDTWLWVYGHIIQGKIMDKWTASSVYNGIVKQKKDPSIIYKQSETQYQLRIYPLAHGENRKIKLTYLLPNSFIGNDMMVNLPGMEMLRNSYSLPDSMKIILKPSPEGVYPSIKGGSSFPTEIEDDLYGSYRGETVPLGDNLYFPDITIPGVLSKGYYLTKFEDANGDNYFQVSAVARSYDKKPRKHLFIVDFNHNESAHNANDIADVLTKTIKRFGANDSVNVLYSGASITTMANTWVAGEEIPNIDPAKFSFDPNWFNLMQGVSMWSDADNVILLSTNNTFVEENSSNSMKTTVLNMLGSDQMVHVFDMWNYYLENGTYDGNRRKRSKIGAYWYDNNDYLYQNLVLNTGGIYRSDIWNDYAYRLAKNYSTRTVSHKETLHSFVEEAFKSGGALLKDYTLKTDLTAGWTYQEYDSKREGAVSYGFQPHTRIGKYKGEGQFEIETAFELDGEVVHEEVLIAENEIFEVDSTLRSYWVGSYINDLELSNPDRNEIKEIINVSMENRVLSRYTSFLCLEPGDTVPICEECFDESDLETAIEPVSFAKKGFVFSMAGMTMNLQFTLPDAFMGTSVSLKIFNLKGQVVSAISLDDLKAGFNSLSVSLADKNLAKGTYVAKLSGAGFTRNVKFTIK